MITDIEQLMDYSERNNEDSRERALRLIAYLEDAGLSLEGNGFLDDEDENLVEKVEDYYESNSKILDKKYWLLKIGIIS